jgi:ubiquinol-cytochrome c reductase cytochrome c1 subunit
MNKPAAVTAFVALILVGIGGTIFTARAADEPKIPEREWSFSGIFGTYDHAQLRRGFQVYNEVCSACHSLNFVAYRDLEQIGFSKDEVKAIAAQKQVTDGPNDQGEMYQRPARPSDHVVPPFANEEQARLANNGALPPDLSLMADARKGGPNYIYAILTGFVNPPPGFKVIEGKFYNAAFPGHNISMPPPLSDGAVDFTDGTPATVDQEATDVAAFLNWAAEPKLEERKEMGVKVMMFLIVLTALLYAVKRKVWRDIH